MPTMLCAHAPNSVCSGGGHAICAAAGSNGRRSSKLPSLMKPVLPERPEQKMRGRVAQRVGDKEREGERE